MKKKKEVKTIDSVMLAKVMVSKPQLLGKAYLTLRLKRINARRFDLWKK